MCGGAGARPCHRQIPHPVIAFRTKHTITLVSQFPHKHIQIVTRLYRSPAEVLLGFDVDACAVAFDGAAVLMAPRAHFALVSQYNTVRCRRACVWCGARARCGGVRVCSAVPARVPET